MGCGHSKINIYPRKSKGKHASKKVGSSGNDGNAGKNGYLNGGDETDSIETTRRGDCIGDTNGGSATSTVFHTTTANSTSVGSTGGNNINGDRCIDDSLQDQNDDDSTSNTTKVKLKPHVRGALLAHTEISESQLNFFRMLDEKVENGPDYDSSSEIEQAKENERLNSLLHDWETASATSRSLSSTPKHLPYNYQQQTAAGGTPGGGPINIQNHQYHQSINASKQSITSCLPNTHQYTGPKMSHFNQQTVHNANYQSYNTPPPPPAYHTNLSQSVVASSHQTQHPMIIPVTAKLVPGIQYADINTTQIKENLSNFVAQRQYQMAVAAQQQAQSRSIDMITNYSYSVGGGGVSGTPSHQITSSPVHKHSQQTPYTVVSRDTAYNTSSNPYPSGIQSGYHSSNVIRSYSTSTSTPSSQTINGDLLLQQQIYSQQLQYQQAKDLQQYKQSREQQLLLQQQKQLIVQAHTLPQHKILQQPQRMTNTMSHGTNYSTAVNPHYNTNTGSNNIEMNVLRHKTASTSVNSAGTPKVLTTTSTSTNPPDTNSPKMLYRKQTTRQYSQELT